MQVTRNHSTNAFGRTTSANRTEHKKPVSQVSFEIPLMVKNELYSMLQRDICALLKQISINKETVCEMKRLIKKKESKVQVLHGEIKALEESKHEVLASLKNCEGVLKQ